MDDQNYLQSSYTGDIYKVMDNYLLKMSPWKDGEDRRVYEYDDSDMHVITYQNACMIVNKQYNETEEEWEYKGKKYKAKALVNQDIDEHTAMLTMLPKHYVKENTKILKSLPDGTEISFKDNAGDEFKMIRHKGKIYYVLLVQKFYPKVPLYDMFFNFCQWVNIKNVKPIFNVTDKKFM